MAKATYFYRRIIMVTFTVLLTLLLSVSTLVHAAPKNSLITHQEYPSQSMLTIKKGSLTISGWAIAQSGVRDVRVLMDGQMVGYASYGGVRNDVHTAYPSVPDSMHSGYSYVLRGIGYGKHEVETVVTSNSGVSVTVTRVLVDRKFPISWHRIVKIAISLAFLGTVFYAVRKMFRTSG